MNKILFFWQKLLSTFWFLPVLMIGLAVILSVSLVYLDSVVSFSQEGLIRYFLVNSSDSARSILSTISGAMIGVAGTVFSVTLVALTLASSQFGPRLIKNFMYVRLNQVVLGSYISTYLYCLIVLNSVRESDDYSFIPSISILMAILAAMANIILLIVFIHQIAVSIQADKVISDISDFIAKQVKRLFAEEIEEEKHNEENVDTEAVISGYQIHSAIKSPKSGYLQYVDYEMLEEVITKNDVLLELNYRPGSYLVRGRKVGTVYSDTEFEKDKVEKILGQFFIGKTKTAQQDIEYSIHQMVEIAMRALSPGINDPYTAITCIDNLTATMCYLAKAKFPPKYLHDEEGKLRVIVDRVDFEGVLDAAFNQIRQFSGGSPAVIIRQMEALITISEFTSMKSYKKAVIKHAEMVLNVGKQTIKENNDLDDLNERAKKVLG